MIEDQRQRREKEAEDDEADTPFSQVIVEKVNEPQTKLHYGIINYNSLHIQSTHTYTYTSMYICKSIAYIYP